MFCFVQQNIFKCVSASLIVGHLLLGCSHNRESTSSNEDLSTRLQSIDTNVRGHALEEILASQFVTSEAAPKLVPLLRDNDRLIRLLSAQALMFVGTEAKSHIPDVELALKQERDPEVRTALQDSLARLKLFP